MATSAIPTAIDWLVDTFRAATTLGQADPPVLVLDGPEVVDLSSPRVLWVGVDDPDPEGGSEGGSSTQDWAGLGAMRKNELLTVPCTGRAWLGDSDVRAARAAAFAILAGAEEVVRANASLGGTVLVTLSGITDIRLRQAVNPKVGAIADVAFNIAAKARI